MEIKRKKFFLTIFSQNCAAKKSESKIQYPMKIFYNVSFEVDFKLQVPLFMYKNWHIQYTIVAFYIAGLENKNKY